MPDLLRGEAFRYVFAASLIYILPIVAADLIYYDDMFRQAGGYMHWSHDGRPVGDILYTIFSMGSVLVDPYPLPLIFAVAAFAIVGGLLCRKWSLPPARFAAGYLLLLTSPFMLSNLYFRYDGAFMLLAIVLACVPLCVEANRPKQFVLGLISLIASLSSYQAAAVIFVALSGLEALRATQVRNATFRDIVYSLSLRAAQFLLALVIYRFIILNTLPVHAHAASYSKLPDLGPGLPTLLYSNMAEALGVIRHAFTGTPGILTLLALVISGAVTLSAAAFSKRPVSHAVSTAVCMLCAIFSILGLQVISASPVFFPRVFVGFGATLMVAVLWMPDSTPRSLFWTVAASLVAVCWITSVVTTNAARTDLQFQRAMASRMISDLSATGFAQTSEVAFYGYGPLSTGATRTTQQFPMAEYALQRVFRNGFDGGRALLMEQMTGPLHYPDAERYQSGQMAIEDATPVLRSWQYDLYDLAGTPSFVFK